MNFSDIVKEIEKTSSYHEEKVKAEVAHQILSSLQEAGMTQKDLAALMNVKPSYVSRVVAAAENLSIKSLVKLAEALDKTLTVKFDSKVVRAKKDKPDLMVANLLRAYDRTAVRTLRPVEAEWFGGAANAESFHVMDFSNPQAMTA